MLLIQDLSYIHPDKTLLFDHINLSVGNHDKLALIGNNGTGKSTLLKIIAGGLTPSSGSVKVGTHPYYIPQVFGQYNQLTIAQALHIEKKRKALKEILSGNVTEENMELLNDDWTIEERCAEALSYWKLGDLDLEQKMETLSGGQKTKVFLAGISIHHPGFVLLDEPSNHLDKEGRALLYRFIQSAQHSFLVVSHDRSLLNLLPAVGELGRHGITLYGGNYDFYAAQKQLETEALNQELKSSEKALRKARETERETMERQQKLDARGKKKQEKAGIPTIMLNTLRNKAEKSTAKIKNTHTEKIGGITKQLQELRKELPDKDKMKFGFDSTSLHKGKILFSASEINFSYKGNGEKLWQQNLDFQILSGERIALQGLNGSGKTTLIKIILGKLEPTEGKVHRAEMRSVYVDQDYSLINDSLNVYEQARRFNHSGLLESEVKTRLTRFLFTREDWEKSCHQLSGGEKMRLILCCLTISDQAPDMLVLDEPTNNLDIQNIEILTAAVNAYAGTLIVVSHDSRFLEQVNIKRAMEL